MGTGFVETFLRESDLKTRTCTLPDADDHLERLQSINSGVESEKGMIVSRDEVESLVHARTMQEFEDSMPPGTDSFSVKLRSALIKQTQMLKLNHITNRVRETNEHRLEETRQDLAQTLEACNKRFCTMAGTKCQEMFERGEFKIRKVQAEHARDSVKQAQAKLAVLATVEGFGQLKQYSTSFGRDADPDPLCPLTLDQLNRIERIIHSRYGSEATPDKPLPRRSIAHLEVLKLVTTLK